MVKPQVAMTIAATRAMTAAICAFTLPDAISASSTTTGIAAIRVDSNSLASGS